MQHRLSRTAGPLALAAAALLLALAGCAPQPPAESASPVPTDMASPVPTEMVSPVPTETVSPVCSSADALAASLDEFHNTLTPDATLEQVGAARDKVVMSYDALVAEVKDVAQERVAELKTQVDRLKATVESVKEGAKVSDAIEELENQADAVDTSLNSLESQLKC
ncbi:hypothetical protein [Paeniglutamicibacter kerguelensis]|uniref:Lipoprotein n=1 Tax=Paeniglutamicibacter kerguelensis TaxID=254788 RepID=A0ABS4XCA0_9MICC|nr:hypothetical protein [Paeniglutamicibacter kerguelensis]MBP2386013.1 hypothetical protein [Paeniglutamicibacter kerguelensis]